MIEFTAEEREYLITALRAAHTQLLRELHHASSKDYKATLRVQIDLNERVSVRVQAASEVPVAV